MQSRIVILLLCLVAAVAAAAIRSSVASTNLAIKPFRYRMPSIATPRGITGRAVLDLPSGPCVVLNYPPTAIQPADRSSLLLGDPETDADDGMMIPSEHRTLSQFNCATYALGDAIGLTDRDWLEITPRVETSFSSPLAIVLDSHFDLLLSIEGGSLDWPKLERDASLAEGDVVCFEEKFGGGAFVVHVGKIHKVDGINQLLSKLGMGPIVQTSIKSCANYYKIPNLQLKLYRKKR